MAGLDDPYERTTLREVLGKLVEGVLDLEQGAAGARAVTIERDVASDCVLSGDPEKLKQVVLNLVMNALDAMKDGGTLRVEVAAEGETVRLVVLDSGIGIGPATRRISHVIVTSCTGLYAPGLDLDLVVVLGEPQEEKLCKACCAE